MEKVIYVTLDGKEFDNCRECEKYCENNGVPFWEQTIKVTEKEKEAKTLKDNK